MSTHSGWKGNSLSSQFIFILILVIKALKPFQLLPNAHANQRQGGITCGAIDEASRSSKAIEKREMINFCNKNAVNACFGDKMMYFYLYDKMS